MKINSNNNRRGQKISQNRVNNRKSLHTQKQISCALEALEDRRLLSGTPVPYGISYQAGTVRINGNDISEIASVNFTYGKLHVSLDHMVYLHVDNNSGMSFLRNDAVADFDPALVSKIEFFGNGGDDQFTNNSTVPSVAIGGAGADSLTGGSAADQLFGDAGDDVIEGRGGDDTDNGGAGNDRYLFSGMSLGSDTIIEATSVDRDVIDLDKLGPAAGNGRLVRPLGPVTLDLSITTKQTVVQSNLWITLSSGLGVEDVVGSAFADTIIGNARANKLLGMGGNDIIHGRAGTDSIYGGTGNDVLYEDTNGGQLFGETGNDRLYAGTDATVLNGGDGEDTLVSIGGSPNDSLIGGAGRDSLWFDHLNSEKLFDDSNDEGANGCLHPIAAFCTNKIVTGNVTQSQQPSLNRFGQNLMDPLADNAAYTKKNFSANPLFASSGPGVNDIVQGALGDCYFVSALAAFAKTNPNKIRQLVVDLGDGTYAVDFRKAGLEATVRVDGDLWVNGTTPAYAGLGAQNSLWVAIIEKAYAFLKNQQGTYASISGGNGAGVTPDEAMWAPKTSFATTSFANATDFLSAMRTQLLAGKAVTVGGPAPFLPTTVKSNMDNPNTAADENTYHRGAHIYTLISVSADLKTIVLRNPWGFDGGGSDANPNDGYVTIPADLAFYCSGGFAAYSV